MGNVKLETSRLLCASCRTSSWSPSQNRAVPPFGLTAANRRAPCPSSAKWRPSQTQKQPVTRFLTPPSPHRSPCCPRALTWWRSTTSCPEQRNCWPTWTPTRTAPGISLGSSRTRPVGLWTGTPRCASCAWSEWAAEEEERRISRSTWPPSTTSNPVTSARIAVWRQVGGAELITRHSYKDFREIVCD